MPWRAFNSANRERVWAPFYCSSTKPLYRLWRWMNVTMHLNDVNPIHRRTLCTLWLYAMAMVDTTLPNKSTDTDNILFFQILQISLAFRCCLNCRNINNTINPMESNYNFSYFFVLFSSCNHDGCRQQHWKSHTVCKHKIMPKTKFVCINEIAANKQRALSKWNVLEPTLARDKSASGYTIFRRKWKLNVIIETAVQIDRSRAN